MGLNPHFKILWEKCAEKMWGYSRPGEALRKDCRNVNYGLVRGLIKLIVAQTGKLTRERGDIDG